MSQPRSHHLLTMAYQNAWANYRLAKARDPLSEAALRAGDFAERGWTEALIRGA